LRAENGRLERRVAARAIAKDIMSESMWKESATRELELVTWPGRGGGIKKEAGWAARDRGYL